MLIVGTAGHIDHGKTTLVGALTGIDTDRLAEEKRRGISIDLGFAHLTGPDGRQISFVDVPGHERFIKNMLAGVGGVAAVLLVVAGDEGVKPQTREHFEICRLLQVPAGIIAINKADLATPGQIAATRNAIAALVKGSFLQNAPVLEVSGKSGLGLEALRTALFALSEERAEQEGLARLNVDRSFTAKGFGTVVTGTVVSGQFRVGETLEVHSSQNVAQKTAKVRGLQVHGKAVEAAFAGERAAINLSGIEHTEIERGCVLTGPHELMPTSLVDASVEWLEGVEAPAKRESYLLHVGTAEILVHLKMLGAGHARLWLDRAALVLIGDRFILRRPSPPLTVGGGTVLDTFPPVRLNRKKVNARLATLDLDSWPQRIELLIEESANGRRQNELVRRTGLSATLLRQHIATSKRLLIVEPSQQVISVAWLTAVRRTLVDWLRDFHAKNPGAAGAPVAQARMNLAGPLAAIVFKDFAEVRVTGDTVALATHQPQSNPEHMKVLVKIEQSFRQAGIQPPNPAAVLQEAGAEPAKARAYLEALIKAQRLVRVSEELVFHAETIAQLRRSLGTRKGRRFTIPEFKEWTQVSRKYAVPLLEYLDRQHVTRREGDSRIVL